MKKYKVSFALNVVIFILVVAATTFMMNNINFMSNVTTLPSNNASMFMYFTTDSNIFMGIIAIIFATYEALLIENRIKEIPDFVYLIKLIATASVALTFITTTFYLAPTSDLGFITYFTNSNLFYHLLVPTVSIINFVFFEKTNCIKIKQVIFSLIPIVLYAIPYSVNALTHIENGEVSAQYDWYNFLSNGINSIVIIIPLMLLAPYMISLIIWKLNKNG